MKSTKLQIVGIFILISLLLCNPHLTSAYREYFSPSVTGEIWEHLFSITKPEEELHINVQIGAFALYNVTIVLDPFDMEPNSVYGYFSTPPNRSLNNNPGFFIMGMTEYFSLSGGEKISFIISSSIHLGRGYITLEMADQENSNTFPPDGISGKVIIQVVEIGLQDNSLYRTEFCLNPNHSSFEFEFDTMISINAKGTTYGKGAEFKAIVSSTANSTGTVLLNISDSFMDIYKGDWYPQKVTTFQAMTVSPGTTHEQNFTMNNDEYDSYVPVPFSLSLVNTSTTAFGNLTVYLEKLGERYSASAESLGTILGFIGLIVIVRKRTKKCVSVSQIIF